MPVLKNAKHEAFAQGLAAGKRPTAAYVDAGYKPSPASATRLSKSVKVSERVTELIGRGADRAEINVARVLRELARLGLSDVRQLVDDSGRLRPLHELDDDTAAAIASVEVVTRPGAEVDDQGNRTIEYVHKIRLWDKNAALDKIAKHLGMFVDRMEHSGPDGGPIEQAVTTIRRIIVDPVHDDEDG